MTSKPDELLPSAKDFMKKLALAEAEEASKQARKIAKAEAEKKALLDQLTKPSGISDEEAIQTRDQDYRARGKQRPQRGSGPSLSQPAVYRPWPRHQSAGAGLGRHAHRRAQGDLSALGQVLPSTRLQAQEILEFSGGNVGMTLKLG